MSTLRVLVAIGAAVLPLCTAAVSPVKKSEPAIKADAVIEQNLKQRLAKSKLAANNFTFKVQNGIVTWNGKTDVIQHKGAATRMAKSAGARHVLNQIVISETARRKAAERLERGRKGGEPKRAQLRLSQ